MSTKQIKDQNELKESTTIIGCGIAGLTTAFYLAKKGHQITVIDPTINNDIDPQIPSNATEASLGVLMGYVSRKSSGRGWKMKMKSMKIWEEWTEELSNNGKEIKIKKPLIKIPKNDKENEFMMHIAKERKDLGIKYEKIYNTKNLISMKNSYGVLISNKDGRIDPILLIEKLKNALKSWKIAMIQQSVIQLKRNLNSKEKRWIIIMANGTYIAQDNIVICGALGSINLVKPLGHTISLEPILGQAVEIAIKSEDVIINNWPGILSINGLNIIHKYKNTFLIGATIEPGVKASIQEKISMLNSLKKDSTIFKDYVIKKEWHYLRARPINEPAPLLKNLEKGLIINSGHYRNGILLAPACAEWTWKELCKQSIH